jgi:hypothetical protein
LEFFLDALPDDIDLVLELDDITVTRISNNLSDDGSWIVYELKPDGLKFKSPILFQVSLDSNNDTIPIVFFSNGAEIELVNNTQTWVDLKNNTQTLSIPLTHFSDLLIKEDIGTYNLKASAQDTPVGSQVPTTASLTLYKDNFLFNNTSSGGGIIVLKLLEPRLTIHGTWTYFGRTGLSPTGSIGGKPGLTDVFVSETMTYEDDTFKCLTQGDMLLTYEIEILTSYKKFSYKSEEDYLAGIGTSKTLRNTKHIDLRDVHFKCLAEVVEDPQTDPGVTPLVELDYNWTYNSENLRVSTNIFVHIEGQSGTTGIVTLSGPEIQPMVQPVVIGQNGQTSITFIVFANGEYTALVEIGGHTVEKKITA